MKIKQPQKYIAGFIILALMILFGTFLLKTFEDGSVISWIIIIVFVTSAVFVFAWGLSKDEETSQKDDKMNQKEEKKNGSR